MLLCSRHESYLAKAASLPDTEDQSMMGRFVRVERQVRSRLSTINPEVSSTHQHTEVELCFQRFTVGQPAIRTWSVSDVTC